MLRFMENCWFNEDCCWETEAPSCLFRRGDVDAGPHIPYCELDDAFISLFSKFGFEPPLLPPFEEVNRTEWLMRPLTVEDEGMEWLEDVEYDPPDFERIAPGPSPMWSIEPARWWWGERVAPAFERFEVSGGGGREDGPEEWRREEVWCVLCCALTCPPWIGWCIVDAWWFGWVNLAKEGGGGADACEGNDVLGRVCVPLVGFKPPLFVPGMPDGHPSLPEEGKDEFILSILCTPLWLEYYRAVEYCYKMLLGMYDNGLIVYFLKKITEEKCV